jgi:hypothetical protein
MSHCPLTTFFLTYAIAKHQLAAGCAAAGDGQRREFGKRGRGRGQLVAAKMRN